MKQVVREILEGNFRLESGSLDFSCSDIALSVEQGRIEEGSFLIYGLEGAVTEGYVVSSDLRMECLTSSFGGSRDEIFYRIDTTAMKAGDKIKGAFTIISNQGEYQIPFSIQVINSAIASSLGEIKNLFHFTNLAKSNWAEAVRLFYEEEFEQILTGNDEQYFAAYKGLSGNPGNERNVEEFLLEIHKKKPVEFIPDEKSIKIEAPASLVRYALVVHRNGWGYTQLQIETDGDFLEVPEKNVTEEAFLGNLYRLYYYIREDKLHEGRNYGRIRLIGSGKTIEIPLTVIRPVQDRKRLFGMHREKKHLILQLMQYYQAFRLKKINSKTWMEETGKLVERLQELDGRDIVAQLFKAQLLLTKQCFHEAKFLLDLYSDDAEEMQAEKPAVYCYYLYLTTLCEDNDEYTGGAAARIAAFYERNRADWRIAWLLLFVSDEYYGSLSAKWTLLEELFTNHCCSPILYLEAWLLLCMNPAMLLRLGAFELQVLNYAAKNEVMKDDVLMQLLYLAQKQKNYSESLLRILITCYGQKAREDILHAICSTLIKGNLYGAKYFKWYRAGVEQNLRITRLYEYYMLSHPLDGREALPKMILMYFSYQNDLTYDRAAYLYAYVHKHQEEMPEIYASYASTMERFVVEQIKRGRINKDLAYLYRNLIVQSMVDEEVAGKLMPLLFMKEITVESDTIRQIVLVYPYGKKQAAYPIIDGHARVPIYDEECKIVLEDERGNRYTNTITYRMEPLITTGKLALWAAPFVREHLGYALYVCYDHKSALDIQEDTVSRFRYLADTDFLLERNRREIRAALVRFYYEKNRMWELDEYLSCLQPEDVAADDRQEIVRIMTLRGMYPEAYAWIEKSGPYGIDAKTLVKLCSRLLVQEGQQEDLLLLGIAHTVLKKGKYDDTILSYLIGHFNGSIKDMRDIWKAAVSFGVDSYELAERIIVQMLYTGAYIGEKMEIFGAYLRAGGKEDVISAFLSQCAYDYVIKEKITEPFLIQSIFRLYREKAELPLVCKLAYLQYYAENPKDVTEEIKAPIREFLGELLNREIILPLFKTYQDYLPAVDMLQDKTILEYRAREGRRVVIHYKILREDGGEAEYCEEKMRDVFAGICVKDFILFFGEKLQYYITEMEDGVEKVTQSGTAGINDAGSIEHENSRFHMINDIMIGRTLQDYDTVDALLEEYYKKDFIVEKLFSPQ
ncbi:MAG: DUF5717 family protein [Muribaculaceae bacterium]|nr:DUF5717 family protein [Muribaculaceae bacterium]